MFDSIFIHFIALSSWFLLVFSLLSTCASLAFWRLISNLIEREYSCRLFDYHLWGISVQDPRLSQHNRLLRTADPLSWPVLLPSVGAALHQQISSSLDPVDENRPSRNLSHSDSKVWSEPGVWKATSLINFTCNISASSEMILKRFAGKFFFQIVP